MVCETPVLSVKPEPMLIYALNQRPNCYQLKYDSAPHLYRILTCISVAVLQNKPVKPAIANSIGYFHVLTEQTDWFQLTGWPANWLINDGLTYLLTDWSSDWLTDCDWLTVTDRLTVTWLIIHLLLATCIWPDRILALYITLTSAEAVILTPTIVQQSLMQILSYAGLVVSIWSMFYHWKRLDQYAVG